MLQGFQPLLNGGRGAVFGATAFLTTPAIWSATTGLGGPLLYNGTASGHSGVTAYIMAVSFGVSTASSVASSIGICTGATTAPTTTTAIDASGNCAAGQQAPLCNVYRLGTVSAAATFYLPLGRVHTGAITVDSDDDNFVHLGGVIAVPPGSFASVSPFAALTSAVMQVGLVWLEVPNF
jgi:hypothetical protein